MELTSTKAKIKKLHLNVSWSFSNLFKH